MLALRPKVTILFVAANVGCHGQLALDVEYRAIEDSIRAGRYRDAFQLIPNGRPVPLSASSAAAWRPSSAAWAAA